MPNSDNFVSEEQVEKDIAAGKIAPVKVPTIDPNAPRNGPVVPGNIGRDPYNSGSLPPNFGLETDLSITNYGGGIPEDRLMPVAQTPQRNAGSQTIAQHVSEVVVAQAIAAIPPVVIPPTPPAPSYTWFYWPAPIPNEAGGQISISANQIYFYAFQLPVSISVTKIAVWIAGFTPTDINSWGIYNSTGNLMCDVGPITVANPSGNNLFDEPVVQGSTTLSAGNYFIALTSKSGDSNFITSVTDLPIFPTNPSSTSSSGGQLPATIVLGSITPSFTTNVTPIFLLH